MKATERMNAMETHHVRVRYGDHLALDDINLDFGVGKVAALIGPSGCGKSTYLRCLDLMNREIPHCRIEGEICYHGEDINTPKQDVYDLRKHIGMVFQQPNPFRKSIYDNIAFALRQHGMRRRSELDERVERSLRSAALWEEVKDKLGKSAYALSGGQQQRLCIARTLALEPDVVLMDEPCSALDPIATMSIEETIRQMADRGICVIIVTHNIEQASRVSDTIAFFLMGVIVENGMTEQVFSMPKDKRTEDYITGRFG